MIELINRLKRMHKHFAKWAKRRNIYAYRVYDRDIPTYPFAIDIYGDKLSINEYLNETVTSRKNYPAWRTEVINTIMNSLGFTKENTYIRTREKQKGSSQYSKLANTNERFVIEEGGLKFLVNLGDYLDTGLFLDHRPLRGIVREEVKDKRFLNLFCYTGSFTAYAAAGGASATVSVDTSEIYLDWLKENLSLNHLSGNKHEFVNMDAREYLESYKGKPFDLIVCDPPVFSTGKKNLRDFDALRDHPELIDSCLHILNPGGILYFSTNFRKFSIRWQGNAEVVDITKKTIPEDFRNERIHTCYRIAKNYH